MKEKKFLNMANDFYCYFFEKLKYEERNESTAHNIGFSSMLAEEYILIFISLSAAVRA